jgi:hypothetical protein
LSWTDHDNRTHHGADTALDIPLHESTRQDSLPMRWLAPKVLVLALTLLGIFSRADAHTISITPGTPFLAKPDVNAEMIAISMEEMTIEAGVRKRAYLPKSAFIARDNHPLMVYTDFQQVRLPDGRTAWVSEHLEYSPEYHGILYRTFPWERDIVPVLIFASLLLLLILHGHRTHVLQDAMSTPGIAAPRVILHALGLLLLLRLTLSSWAIFQSGNIICVPIDEQQYFTVASDISHGILGRDWHYTIGLPLIYVPFLIFTGADSYFDIVGAVSLFNAYIVAPACLAMFFLILQTLLGSTRKAFAAVLVASIMPFLYFPVELHVPGETISGVFKGISGPVGFNQASYLLFYLFTAIGYHGLSDHASTALILLSTLLGLQMRPGMRSVMAISAIFAFACLVRISNIVFSPLIAFLFWEMNKARFWERPKTVFVHMAAAAGAFLLVFMPQLIVNAMNYGGALTFPYVLHENRAAEGFSLSAIPGGIHYLFGCNYFYMACGAVGLGFCRNRKTFILLALLSIPIVLFYCGYPVVGASPIRFILTAYLPLTAAFVIAAGWQGLRTREAFILAGVVAANLLLVSPCHRLTPPFPWELELIPGGKEIAMGLSWGIPLASLAVVLILFRKQRGALMFALAFLGLYSVGSTLLASGIMMIILAIAVILWMRNVIGQDPVKA